MPMVGTRVTHRTIFEGTVANLQQSLRRSQELQEQLSSGKRIGKPSDDATGTISAMQHRTSQRVAQQHIRNADDGLGWLGQTDSSLQAALNSTRSAYTKLLQGANSGVGGPQAQEALAQEIRQLRDEVLVQANAQYNGRPVFGGTNASNVAFSTSAGPPPTWTFDGGSGVVNRQITPTDKVQVNTPGSDAFQVNTTIGGTSGTYNVFQILEHAANAIETNDSGGISEAVGNVRQVMDQMTSALSSVGARYRRIEAAGEHSRDYELEAQSRISSIESIDLARSVMDLQMQTIAHQAALGATAKVMQPSLMDFLR